VSEAPRAATGVGERLRAVRARMEAAARRAGRTSREITLIGITKTMPVARIREAVEAGLTHLGENRVQEADPKILELTSLNTGLTWHLVGHLQSNKARKAVELFDWIQSIHDEKLAATLQRHAESLGRSRDVLVQVDLAGEATKFGLPPESVAPLLRAMEACPALRVRGLMTIPPNADEPEASRPYFRRLRELRDTLAAGGRDLPELSMGMTNDFEVAIEEGATMVRVGRAIFGEREAGSPGGA